ncbi:hypothetical protein ACFE04_026940 [Oxalis oulophora]
MVAISLYRGNLHRVPDVPRRYDMPPLNLSLNDFKNLLNRRNAALSRLHSSPGPEAATSSKNPNPNNIDESRLKTPGIEPQQVVVNVKEEPQAEPEAEAVEVDDERVIDHEKKPIDEKLPDYSYEFVIMIARLDIGHLRVYEVRLGISLYVFANGFPTDKADDVNDREKRKRDVEEELEVLNAKKHKLVLALKQILNVEEELKRRNTGQGMANRPSVPFQPDAVNDLGSPSSDSTLRRTTYIQQNMVPHPPRVLGVSSSPSRFAPPPAVSVSGTNYIASSPSPAASGGTPVFRQPSPWN